MFSPNPQLFVRTADNAVIAIFAGAFARGRRQKAGRDGLIDRVERRRQGFAGFIVNRNFDGPVMTALGAVKQTRRVRGLTKQCFSRLGVQQRLKNFPFAQIFDALGRRSAGLVIGDPEVSCIFLDQVNRSPKLGSVGKLDGLARTARIPILAGA